MKISKSKLKRIIKEELEEARLMDPSTRGKRMAAFGSIHQGDMTPEEEWRWKTGLKLKSDGYNHGLNGQPWGGGLGTGFDPGQFTSEYTEGYKSGLADSRKGETDLMPYEAELAGLEEPRIGTRMGPYKDEYAAAPPEEHDPGREVDAYKNPRNPAYARPVNEIKITKSQLKQIIKEELEGLIGEAPGDAASIKKAQKLPAIEQILYNNIKGLPYDQATALAGEIYRLSGGDDNESARIAAMIAQRIVKVAGDVTDYRKRKLAVNDALKALKGQKSKPQGGAEKPQATSSKPPEHIQRMKRGATKRHEGEITVSPVRGKSGIRYVASAVKAGKQYKSKSYPNVEGAKADVRGQMADNRGL